MMKIYHFRSFAVLLVLLLSMFISFGQCEPDPQYNSPGLYPDTSDNLDTAFVGLSYEQVVTAIVPKDTLVFGSPIPIDSIGIIQVRGLPYGFTYEPNTKSGFWPGDSKGCVLLSGMPYDSQVGVHPLHIDLVGVVGGMKNPYTLEGFKILIDFQAGVHLISKNKAELIIFPNPVFDNLGFYLNINQMLNAEISVIDISGKSFIRNTVSNLNAKGVQSLDVSTLPKGMYILQLRTDQQVWTSSFYKN